uniref:Ribosomal protein L7Ae/L30e/S12e/Gadd45 n=1 Tax=Tanacetum cinerariifolium TaxID=118510 RepID=A0A699HDS0_TANCI|nr:ribosomal protein L7Ae/L30e/S12e/Gadd45 [Tanacetum cinerariifolium]
MAKRMKCVTKQARLILPYGMLLTRLFDFIIGENPKLKNESYVLYDYVMNPLAAQLERKTIMDRGTISGRHSTSSTTFNQPSSHLNDDDDDDDDDGNNEGTSRASTPSPIRVLALEKTKTTKALEITSLKRRVKKLKKKKMSRTHKLKRLYKGRIKAIDADEDITLVNDQDDADDVEMFDVTYLLGEEVFINKDDVVKEVNAAGELNAASIATTNSAAATITTEEVTLAKVLAELKALKPKVKGVFIQGPSESITTTISSKKLQDKGKGIMVEEPVKPKKKERIKLDEEAALKLQGKFEEEQRLAREKAQKELEANIALIEIWDDVQAKIDADYQLTKRMVNTFKSISSELVEGNSKRAGEEIEQERSKKKKIDDDEETTKLKKLMGIIPNEEEVAIDAIPLAVKYLKIVDWKIHKEGRKSYYQTIRADGSFKMYMVFNRMLKEFDKEDLEDLYSLVKAKYGLTRPVKDLDLLLWGDLKTMFEPHVEDQVWKKQHGYKVLE